MTWGTGSWGTTNPWGTGTALPPPTLVAVSSEPGPTAPRSNPATVAIKGGTVCQAFGTNFFDPMTVQIGTGNAFSFTALLEGYIFDPAFDLRSNSVYFGAPRLLEGLYSLRVVTEGGPSNVLENVISARLFADEFKTVSVRGKFAPKWKTGPRILRGI